MFLSFLNKIKGHREKGVQNTMIFANEKINFMHREHEAENLTRQEIKNT